MTLPPSFSNDDDDPRPIAYRTLFDDKGDITKITETPASMIIPMTRMSVIVAATQEDRTETLIEVFQKTFDARMISKDRKGRIEAVELMQALNRNMGDENEIPL